MSLIELARTRADAPRPAWAPPANEPAGLETTPLPKLGNVMSRAARHRHLMHYNRLIAAVGVVNAIVAVYALRHGWFSWQDPHLRTIAAVAQANFVVAALPRQQWMINLISAFATRPSHRWPLKVRWTLGKYYQFGGMHVGASVSAAAWYLVFVVALTSGYFHGVDGATLYNVLISAAIVGLFVAMIFMAMPEQRRRHHDRFEVSHRFLAWAALALVWANLVLFVAGQQGDRPLLVALATTPASVLLALTTAFALWPWLLLRRIPVSIERPSDHVAIVKLDHDIVPRVGTTRPISRHPFVGWHQFGCVPPVPGERGYRMAVSRAGDWTGEFIDAPPTHVWVRGIPAAGVANVRRLFKRVVFVATGSGIGPGLSHILDSGADCRLVWITRDPIGTYGEGLVAEILAAQPDALIWNTDERGKPDVLRLAYGAAVDFGAEAVICISNKKLTWTVVEGLEQRGIPAFGPIWDS